MNLEGYLQKQAALVDRHLAKFLPKGKSKLEKAMRYTVFAGGKRFRPILILATAEIFGKSPREVMGAACAVEIIHTFTLIHDDLPALDDSDMRRGQASCHKVFGEDIAILAGDALNTLAFKIIATSCKPTKVAQVSVELSSALLRVVEGQVLDLESEGKKINLNQLRKIHLLKTASMIQACLKMAAILCNARDKEIKALSSYATHLGLAFQISDDILDVVSSSKVLGKPTGADKILSKATYPSIVGLRKAESLVERNYLKAISSLEIFGKKAGLLKILADFVIRRKA